MSLLDPYIVQTLTPLTDNVAPTDLVHVTLIAEAYTSQMQVDFFNDMSKLVNESFLSSGSAFESLLPLLAVHAIHVPSESASIPNDFDEHQSGRSRKRVGLRGNKGPTGGAGTFFGLRREDGPLRTVAPPGNGRKAYSKAKQVCAESAWAVAAASSHGSSGRGALHPANDDNNNNNRMVNTLGASSSVGCDHVMLVAHDPWYGGLGEEVAIFTSSKTSGGLALRHELGHILADVGEEYDGGGDYSG